MFFSLDEINALYGYSCGNKVTPMVSYLVNNLRKWLSVIILHGRIIQFRHKYMQCVRMSIIWLFKNDRIVLQI